MEEREGWRWREGGVEGTRERLRGRGGGGSENERGRGREGGTEGVE